MAAFYDPAEIFSDRPTDPIDQRRYTIKRIPRGRDVQGVVLSTTPLWVRRHFTPGGSKPCLGSVCEWCDEKIVPPWYGYLFCWSFRTNEIWIAEFTKRVEAEMVEWISKTGSLRGAWITLSRTGDKVNSPHRVALLKSKHGDTLCPDCPDLRAALMYIWRIKALAPIVTRPSQSKNINKAPTRSAPKTNGHAIPIKEVIRSNRLDARGELS